MPRRHLRPLLGTALILGCSTATPLQPADPLTAVHRIVLDTVGRALIPGQILIIAAAAVDDLGHSVPAAQIEWRSSAAGIATVSADGVVHGVAPGTTTITATADGVVAYRQVFVEQATPFVLTTVAIGDGHACGLTPNGAAWCWGWNASGELGDGTTTDALRPVQVVGGHTFVAISAGGDDTCGLTASGDGWCWGGNFFGSVGDGTVIDRLQPVQIMPGQALLQISAGGAVTCALTVAGEAWCWGANTYGQVGDNTVIDKLQPTRVLGGLTFTQISATTNHVCAIRADGAAWCWGLAGTSFSNFTPVKQPTLVPGGLVFSQVSSGFMDRIFCGATTSAAGSCWGGGTQAQAAVTGGLAFAQIGTGATHACGRTTAGAAWCWGANYTGQLGDGVLPARAIGGTTVPDPVAVLGGHTFAQLSVGPWATCGRTTVNEVWCWGTNYHGELGDATTSNRAQPVQVAAP